MLPTIWDDGKVWQCPALSSGVPAKWECPWISKEDLHLEENCEIWVPLVYNKLLHVSLQRAGFRFGRNTGAFKTTPSLENLNYLFKGEENILRSSVMLGEI